MRAITTCLWRVDPECTDFVSQFYDALFEESFTTLDISEICMNVEYF